MPVRDHRAADVKTIIAGSRSINNYQEVYKAIRESGFPITEVVSGGARGVDRLGEVFANAEGIPIKRFEPDWSRGKGAGFARNWDMAYYADALIAVWDGESSGTQQMIDCARKRKLRVHIHTVL